MKGKVLGGQALAPKRIYLSLLEKEFFLEERESLNIQHHL
jgi:hypothetical protein